MIKVCSCGRQYSSGTWKLLPYVGEQDDGVERLELRNCVCRSTLSIVLESSASSPPPPVGSP